MVKGTKIKSIKAFTIFEVTVVLAILGILITIISVSLNRFNEQLKLNSELQGELSHWMLVRSNLWREYYDADSIKLTGNLLTFYQPTREIMYQESEDILMRKEGVNEWTSMKVGIEEIKETEISNKKFISFSFLFKNENLELNFYTKKNNKQRVNTYYEELK